MEKQRALDVLNEVKGKVIRDAYDTKGDVQEAILLLYPNFEYPDWSHKFVWELITFVSC